MLDWRGWLGISETALALLVALVSVLGASAPRVAELFTRNYSDVRLNYRQVNSQYLELTAWNQGNKNGLLSSAKMIARNSGGMELGSIKLEVSSPPLILAGQQAVSGFRIPPAQILDFLAWPHKDIQSVSVIANVVEFGKQAQERAVDVPIVEFRQFCRATEDSDNQARHGLQAAEQRQQTRCM
jgi:hypothetical protein